MFLKPFFSIVSNTSNHYQFQFTRQQASHFAKKIAGDFNPIHDEDSSRFCVPGDLLFAVLLQKEGISEKIRVDFSGMVTEGINLHIAQKNEQEIALVNDNGKEFLHLNRVGAINRDPSFIEHIVTSYVQFSGMNFPHIMVPLMEEQQMMINCQRPLVIYENMEMEFDRLDLLHPEVSFNGATFDITGKRGTVTLNFEFKEDSQVVGRGIKRMIASGLRAYNAQEIEQLVERFRECKIEFAKQFESV